MAALPGHGKGRMSINDRAGGGSGTTKQGQKTGADIAAERRKPNPSSGSSGKKK